MERRKMEFEREERERMNLQKMIHGEVSKSGSSVSAAAKEAVFQQQKEGANDEFSVLNPQSPSANALLSSTGTQRKLRIYRTIRNADGIESVNC
jgi:hypothetical protein